MFQIYARSLLLFLILASMNCRAQQQNKTEEQLSTGGGSLSMLASIRRNLGVCRPVGEVSTLTYTNNGSPFTAEFVTDWGPVVVLSDPVTLQSQETYTVTHVYQEEGNYTPVFNYSLVTASGYVTNGSWTVWNVWKVREDRCEEPVPSSSAAPLIFLNRFGYYVAIATRLFMLWTLF